MDAKALKEAAINGKFDKVKTIVEQQSQHVSARQIWCIG